MYNARNYNSVSQEAGMRPVFFGIKLTEDERRQIEEAAQREGRPASNLARHLILTALRTDDRAPAKAESSYASRAVTES